MKILDYLTDFLIGIVFTVFFISVGFVLALNFKTLYYNDVELLNIESTASLDKEIVKNNYDEIVTYIKPTSKNEIALSNFTLSEAATKHLYEVKNMYRLIYVLAIFGGIASLIIIIQKIKHKDYRFLLISSIVSSAVPFLLLGGFSTKFKSTFDNFCNTIFMNNSWKLSVKSDPIVNIFPERYFQHSAIAIFSFSLVCGICLLVLWKGLKERCA